MKLTAEQTEDLPFPIGCPVWYNFSETASDEGALKQGVVESVSFNYSTKDLLYEVVYKDGDDQKGAIAEEVSEHKLAFGANCPVTIDCNGDESAVEEGTILLCEPSSSDPSQILYTVMIFMEESQARYEDGIDAKRIRYRKEKVDTNVAGAVKTDAPVAGSRVHNDQPSARKNTDPPTANKSVMAEHPDKEPVPSSITCDSVSKNSHQNSGEKGAASSNKRAHAPDIASPMTTTPKKSPDTSRAKNFGNYKQDSHRSINSHSHESVSSSKDNTRFEIKTPYWLQRDRDSQNNLFFHLIGSKREGFRGNRCLKDIERETNCSIKVNNVDKRSGSFLHPMTISVVPRAHQSQANKDRDTHFARVKIQDLLLDYVGHDGSRGRLLYEAASSCSGAHRPKGSLSGAVKAKDPFATEDGPQGFMTLMHLPFEVIKGKNQFHVDFLLTSSLLKHVWVETNCYVKACVNGSGIPIKLCYPYLLVMGKDWRGVDRAFGMLNQAIKEHMYTCSCTFKKYTNNS